MYHLGLVKELLAHGLLPAVVSGTSGGAIVAGLLACRTDEELPAFITEDVSTRDGHRWFDDAWTCIRRLATDGVVVNKEAFLAALEPICGDLTFAEAFARTGRLVNLSTSTTSLGATLLLNHIVTPNVLVRSAIQASCALTGVMRPGTLLAKAPDGSIVPLESAGLLFRDGSFQSDIPMRELSAQFHATHFIVSQVNAHVAPFLYQRAEPCSWLARLQRFIVTDVRARLDKYAKAHDYLPTELQNLVAQEYVGRAEDVTIFPRLRLSDLTWRILRHPTAEDMRTFLEGGARMGWPHLHRLQCQTLVERALLASALEVGMEVHTPRLAWTDGRRWPRVPSLDEDGLRLPAAVAATAEQVGDTNMSAKAEPRAPRASTVLSWQLSWPALLSPGMASHGVGFQPSTGPLIPDVRSLVGARSAVTGQRPGRAADDKQAEGKDDASVDKRHEHAD